jgi:hypothetical protein
MEIKKYKIKIHKIILILNFKDMSLKGNTTYEFRVNFTNYLN